MATTLRLYYNPYLCKMKMSILNSNNMEEEIDGTAKDEIDSCFKERFCLEDDGETLLDILLKSYRGSNINIEFVGTSENFVWFNNLCTNHQVKLCKSTRQRILSCDEISKNITEKVKQLKKQGYDIDSNGEIDKILDATIPVVVVGNMSAGKSTFLNSLIGEELLPSGQNRTTGVNCSLHNSSSEIRVKYCVNEKLIDIDCTDLNSIKNNPLIPSALMSELEKKKISQFTEFVVLLIIIILKTKNNRLIEHHLLMTNS